MAIHPKLDYHLKAKVFFSMSVRELGMVIIWKGYRTYTQFDASILPTVVDTHAQSYAHLPVCCVFVVLWYWLVLPESFRLNFLAPGQWHYSDVIMGAMASQIASLTIVYLTVHSDQRKHQSSASLALVRGIHRWPVNSPHIWPVTRKMFPFDDVIMMILGSA